MKNSRPSPVDDSASSTRSKPYGRDNLDPRNEIRNHAARPEDVAGVEDSPDPFVAPDVAILARAQQRKEPRVPYFVVRVIDLHAGVPEGLKLGLRQGLDDDFRNPPAGESLVDRSGVARVEIGFPETVEVFRDAPARDRERFRLLLAILLVNDLERLDDFVDFFHRVVRPAGGALLPVVLVDIAELAFFLEAEVLALPVDGEVDQVPPLDRGGHFRDRFSAAQGAPVVRRRGGELHLGERRALAGQHEASVANLDAVRGSREDAHAHDRSAEFPRAAEERDFFGSAQVLLTLQLVDGPAIEAENEVALGLRILAKPQRLVGEVHADPEEVFFHDRLAGRSA
jgi:hypothetical protein